MKGPWWLYLIECQGGSIYTGIALDVDERYRKHASGVGAKYTRMNPPQRLLARQPFPDRSAALKAEYAMKQLTAAQKRQWALALNPELQLPAAAESS